MTPSSPDIRPYLEELERFADGQMSEAEQEVFAQRLEQDAALAAAFQAYEQLTADLRWVAGHETLRLRLEALDRRLDQRNEALERIRRKQRKTQIRWGLVAGVAAALLLGLWLVLRPSAASPADSWAQYYVPDAGLPGTAIRGDRQPLLSEAMSQYQAGHYPQALHALRRIPTSTLGQDTLLYYTGIFLLSQSEQELDKTQEAQTYLKRVAQQPGSALAGKARYHLGMAYWRNQQPEQARTALQLVADDVRNPYQQAARRLLKAEVLPR